MTSQADNYLPTQYQQFIYISRYARWLPEENRRETWPETVGRYFDFFTTHLKENNGYSLKAAERKELEEAILSLKVMPSMRALMTAGPALVRDNIAGYNCSYIAINRLRAFDELMYVLLCGTGVGFSVERDEIMQLPLIADDMYETETTIVVRDSKLGWAKAFKELLAMLFAGQVPGWDVSRVRGPGERLKTFGGRASGPEPLEELFRFAVEMISNAKGRKLTSLECHDLVCKIAEIVVVGGVRRSALISLSNLTDDRMRDAKSGQWWIENGQRALSNNSACYTEKPDIERFMEEWISLVRSKSGERGIFSRAAAQKHVERLGDRRDPTFAFGTNPCSEIILRDRELCNLAEAIARATDSVADLKEKIRLATIIGTIQATLTNFRYITSEWVKNCEEERLLGVSLTGIMDHPVLNRSTNVIGDWNFKGQKLLEELKQVAIDTNKEWAKKFKINPAAAITCVKPSGTVSQLTDAASGIHTRHSPYYIRTVRADNKDPLCQFMIDKGFPHEPDVNNLNNVTVFSFPVKSPEGSLTRNDYNAMKSLDHWKMIQDHWTEHKPSITVNVKDDEWLDVGAWVYRHFDELSGISFLPYSDHIYKQAPYQECTKEEYEELAKQIPDVDWSELVIYEQEDATAGAGELACAAGVCEVVDLVNV